MGVGGKKCFIQWVFITIFQKWNQLFFRYFEKKWYDNKKKSDPITNFFFSPTKLWYPNHPGLWYPMLPELQHAFHHGLAKVMARLCVCHIGIWYITMKQIIPILSNWRKLHFGSQVRNQKFLYCFCSLLSLYMLLQNHLIKFLWTWYEYGFTLDLTWWYTI